MWPHLTGGRAPQNRQFAKIISWNLVLSDVPFCHFSFTSFAMALKRKKLFKQICMPTKKKGNNIQGGFTWALLGACSTFIQCQSIVNIYGNISEDYGLAQWNAQHNNRLSGKVISVVSGRAAKGNWICIGFQLRRNLSVLNTCSLNGQTI